MDNHVLALIAGFIAMALVASSYFVKKKLHYLVFQLLGIVFLVLSYFFSENFFAMAGLIVAFARTVTFALYENRGIKAPLIWPFIFAALSFGSYFITSAGSPRPEDALFLAGLVGYAFIFRIRSLKLVRFLMLAPTVLSVLYNVLIPEPIIFVVISYSFELAANVVSIFKYHVFTKEKRARKLESKNFQTP